LDNTNLQKQLDELKKDIEQLKQKRVFQQDIVPGAVKMRAMGEANRFVRSGLEADLPDKPETGTDSSACYFATDTDTLYIFNGSVWVSTTLL
jgi:hypothetical protein